jgi:hypothetical protein
VEGDVKLREVAMAAVTDVGFVRMRVSKVVGLKDGDDVGAVLMRRALAAGPMTIKRIDP